MQKNELGKLRDYTIVVAEAEAPILCPPDVKSLIIGKHSDVGKIEGKRRRGQQRIDGWMVPLTQCT